MEQERVREHEDIYSLVEKVKEGDREAFMRVTQLYQKKVFLLAYSFFQNKEDAMDIVQETFMRFYQKANLFQKGKNFQNWLLQIAKNICIDYHRKHHSKETKFDREVPIEEMNLPAQNSQACYLSSDLAYNLSCSSN